MLTSYYFLTLFFPLWFLQRLLLRNKRIWVFGCNSGLRYADNAKYLFRYVNENKQYIRSIWLTRNENVLTKLRKLGFKCYKTSSLLGVYYSLRAGVVCVTHGVEDVNMFAINGAHIFQLWHGMPSKSHTIDSVKKKAYKLFFNKYIFFAYYKWNYMLATADVFEDLFVKDFSENVRKGYMLLGQPRCDAFFTANTDILIKSYQEKFNSPKFILYAPTFRDRYSFTFRKDIAVQGSFDYFEPYGFNAEKFQSFLTKHNLVFLIKAHYSEEKLGNSDLDRIVFVDENEIEDINTLMKDTDLLITDYSGVYYDFLLVNKPVIFAPFDYKDYTKYRKTSFDYFNEFAVGGPKAYNWKEVMFEIENFLVNEKDEYIEKRKLANKKFNQFEDVGNNCSKVYEFITKKC